MDECRHPSLGPEMIYGISVVATREVPGAKAYVSAFKSLKGGNDKVSMETLSLAILEVSSKWFQVKLQWQKLAKELEGKFWCLRWKKQKFIKEVFFFSYKVHSCFSVLLCYLPIAFLLPVYFLFLLLFACLLSISILFFHIILQFFKCSGYQTLLIMNCKYFLLFESQSFHFLHGAF